VRVFNITVSRRKDGNSQRSARPPTQEQQTLTRSDSVRRLRAVPVGRRIGSAVVQRPAAGPRSTATAVRGQVRAATPRPVGGRRRQAERAVQTGTASSVRPPAGVRQAGGPARS